MEWLYHSLLSDDNMLKSEKVQRREEHEILSDLIYNNEEARKATIHQKCKNIIDFVQVALDI